MTTLPTNLRRPVFVKVMFALDQSGNMTGCRPQIENESAALVAIACEQLGKTFHPQPARSKDGNLVASEQNASVVFEAK